LEKIKLLPTRTTICGLDVPSMYHQDGIQADLVLFITAEESEETFLAWGQACSQLGGTRRPIFGQVNFNLNKINPSKNGMKIEKDLLIILHEITHVLGFSNELYGTFPTKPEVESYNVKGQPLTYINLLPLTERLRKHFGCPTLPGAFLENEGGDGSAGSHFERKIFMNEYMTASQISDQRMTEFTLAFLEGTGWYKVNYEMAEPIYWGKGQGCQFVEGSCVSESTGKPSFGEFCSTAGSQGCTFHRRHGGHCGDQESSSGQAPSDIFADNCPYVNAYANVDCENPDSSSRSIIGAEVYGQNSKCFMGTLYPTGALKKEYQYCLQSKCLKQENGDYHLKLMFGSTSVECTKEEYVNVSGYSGTINCPDPNQFCTTVGISFCKRGCLGRGTCGEDGKCQCKEGWAGVDCGLKLN
jgi:leishmanolysin